MCINISDVEDCDGQQLNNIITEKSRLLGRSFLHVAWPTGVQLNNTITKKSRLSGPELLVCCLVHRGPSYSAPGRDLHRRAAY